MTALVPARPCPPEILARTRNAKVCVAKAEAGGWASLCTYAIVCEEETVQSILLRVQRGPVAMRALWTGDVGVVDNQGRPAGLGFDGAWLRDGRTTRRITYTQFTHYLVDPSTEPQPGPKVAAKLREVEEREQEEMLSAIGTAADVLGASFVRVQPVGEDDSLWCRGHIIEKAPRGRQRCTNPAAPGLPYCDGPCVRE